MESGTAERATAPARGENRAARSLGRSSHFKVFARAGRMDGGTAHLLPRERQQATFDVKRMTEVLFGGPEAVARRRFILAGNADSAPFVHEELDREELIARGISNFMGVHEPYFKRATKLHKGDQASMFDARTVFSGVTNSWGMFLTTILSHGSDEQKGWWAGRTMKGEMIGCYAQSKCRRAVRRFGGSAVRRLTLCLSACLRS